MAKRTQAKLLKKLQYRYGDFRGLDDFDDDGFAYLMQKVKGVYLLDLNETDISNQSIKLLMQLEYVKEIRAKGCHGLNNDCIPYLSQIPSIEFLHLKYTEITIDGLLRLSGLPNLKTLMFSADDEDDSQGKLLELHALLPDCELVVNGKPQRFEE